MTNESSNTVIAVYETRPYWGPELQRQFVHAPIVIRECRTIGNLLPSISGFESSLLVIDIDSEIEACLEWFGSQIRNDWNRLPIIACGTASTADLEWRLREAGVTAFLPDVISGDMFARLCRRQLGIRNN